MRLFLPIILLLSLRLHGDELAAWHDDYAAAQREAQASKIPMLLEFTGLDWCPPCIHLHEELLDTAEFRQAAAGKFVLTSINFPKHQKLSKRIEEQNHRLAARYHIDGYPTIVLTNAEGLPFWIEVGAVHEKPTAYLEQLERRYKCFDAYLNLKKDAQSAPPGVNAQLMADALKKLPDTLVLRYYTEDLKQLATLDPDDRTGYRSHLHARSRHAEKLEELSRLFANRDYGQIVERIDKFLADPEAAMAATDRQQMLLRRAFACSELKAFSEALESIDRMEKTQPDSHLGQKATQMRAFIRHQQEDFKRSQLAAPKKTSEK